jgi:hypothetical protein
MAEEHNSVSGVRNVDAADRFHTKTGECVVSQERVLLTRFGWRGTLAQMLFFGGSAARPYAALLAFFLMMLLRCVLLGQLMVAAFYTSAIAVLCVVLVRSRDVSAASEIPVGSIRRIQGVPPVAGVVRGHFIIHFDDRGSLMRRYVILPGVVEGGGAEYAHASAVLSRIAPITA